MVDSSTDLLKKRIQQLAKHEPPKNAHYVLYVMSRDQRVQDNYALLAAQKHAHALKLPLQVVFFMYSKSGFRAREHFGFMLDGLKEVGASLTSKNIGFSIVPTDDDQKATITNTLHEYTPAAVYLDFNPLHGPTRVRSYIASAAQCSVYVVDTHNIVPVWVTSDKQEVAARTIRPKVQRNLPEFLVDPEQVAEHHHGTAKQAVDWDALHKIVAKIPSNGQKLVWKAGEDAAHAALDDFITNRLDGYDEKRNDPSLDHQSNLSPYLHYGQIASARVALTVQGAVQADSKLSKSAGSFLEELIVRRELSDNFCWYNKHYLELAGAPQWAQDTLKKHTDDPREHMYTYKEFEAAKTHDPAWNAAQLQLTKHGKMHGYMRMYWAKKVLEWSNNPEAALRTLIQLNDHYTIDGGDPNGYVGIMWSVAGVHDRPWGERPIYGVIRSMVYNGLKRKFDIQAYIDQQSS